MSKYTDRRIYMQTAAQAKIDNLKLTAATVKRTNAIYQQASRDIERQVEAVYKQFGVLDKANHWNFTGLNNPATKKDAAALIKAIEKAGLTDYVPENLTKRLSVIQAKQLSNWLTIQRAGQDSHALTKNALLKNVQNTGKVWKSAKKAGAMSFVGFDRNIVGYMVGMNWDNGNFSTRLWNASNATWEKVRDELALSLANGQPLETTKKHMRQLLAQGHNPYAKGSGGLNYDVERIIRTEMAKAATNADVVRWNEMGVSKVQWNASFEAHTCDDCGERDGRVYELDKLRDTIPLHPNCRCYFTPYDEVAEQVADQRTAEYKDENGDYQRIAWAPLNSLMERIKNGYALRLDPLNVSDYFFSVSPWSQYTAPQTGLDYIGEQNDSFVDLAERTIQDAINQYQDIETYLKRYYDGKVNLHRGLSTVTGNKTKMVGGYVDISHKDFVLTYPVGMGGKNVLKELQEIVNNNYSLGFWSSNSIQHTINHELGHVLEDRFGKNTATIRNIVKSATGTTSMAQAKKVLESKISKYAATNADEAFAELFARSMAQDTKLNNEIVARFQVALNKELKKKTPPAKITIK